MHVRLIIIEKGGGVKSHLYNILLNCHKLKI
jgi:hypothetical protein